MRLNYVAGVTERTEGRIWDVSVELERGRCNRNTLVSKSPPLPTSSSLFMFSFFTLLCDTGFLLIDHDSLCFIHHFFIFDPLFRLLVGPFVGPSVFHNILRAGSYTSMLLSLGENLSTHLKLSRTVLNDNIWLLLICLIFPPPTPPSTSYGKCTSL